MKYLRYAFDGDVAYAEGTEELFKTREGQTTGFR
jgi:hypothetical protein